ncbi:AzlD domain-containing protein [Marinomonas epiphytica]
MTVLNAISILFGMFAVTFCVRFVLFARANKFKMPDWVERALKFVPVAVLTAIISPMVFMPNQEFDLSISNPWLLGGVASLVVGIWRQQQLLTICVGVAVFFLSKYFFN